jgi:hypothetical protein
MKTTVEIHDALLKRAQKHAAASGTTLRALVEQGLRQVLEAKDAPAKPFELRDQSVGKRGADNPLESFAWSELRDEIYGGR